MYSFQVDLSQLKGLPGDFHASVLRAVEAVGRRGAELLAEEEPQGRTGALKRGVGYQVSADGLHVDIYDAAERPAAGPQTATLYLVSGRTKQVQIGAQPAFSYAQAVATGTGVYGPSGRPVQPKRARVLLIPVESVAAGEAYLQIGAQRYVVRPEAKGMPANPFDRRAYERLVAETPQIVTRALTEGHAQS